MIFKRDMADATAQRAYARTRNVDPEVAVISEDRMNAVVLAAALRRAGIGTLTFLSGNQRSQLKRGVDADVEMLVIDGPTLTIRDRRTRLEQPTTPGSLADDVMACLLFDWTVTFGELDFLGELR